MNQLRSLMTLVTINARPVPSSMEGADNGHPLETDNVRECRSNVKDATMPSQLILVAALGLINYMIENISNYDDHNLKIYKILI